MCSCVWVCTAQGGECNYLLRLRPSDYRLEFVPDAEWQMPEMKLWTQQQVKSLLDGAQQLLEEGAERLRLPVQVRDRLPLSERPLGERGRSLTRAFWVHPRFQPSSARPVVAGGPN